MLLNNRLQIAKYSLIGLALIFIEFFLYTQFKILDILNLQIIFIIPFLAYLVLKDFDKQNMVFNYIVASILSYEYALITGYDIIFVMIAFFLIIYATYSFEFHNSRLNIYIYSNFIYLGYFALRVIYFIIIYQVKFNLANIVLVNIFVPSVFNAIIMYFLVSSRLETKVKNSKYKRYTF